MDNGVRPKDPHAARDVGTGGKEEGVLGWRRAGGHLRYGILSPEAFGEHLYPAHTFSEDKGLDWGKHQWGVYVKSLCRISGCKVLGKLLAAAPALGLIPLVGAQ
ncbi:hypothetical protein H1C71_028579 [Ictidomys tridecemlineatus]|nr:hypothetical protein H1C71_028579 [Ictidomys tridecemlineatus]